MKRTRIQPTPGVAPARNAGRAMALWCALLLTACSSQDTGPGAPTQIEPSATIASVAAGTPVATTPSVTIKDAKGRPVPGVSVTFVVSAGGGSVSGGNAVTNETGVASAGSWTLGTLAGPNVLTASSSALGGRTVDFTVFGVAGPAARALNAGGSASGIVGAPLPIPPAVLVTDAFGNAVRGTTVTFVVSQGGGSVTGGSQLTNANGVASPTAWVLGNIVGGNTMLAVATGVSASVSFVVSATAAAAATVVQNGGSTSGAVRSATATPPSVLVRDAFGNPVPSVPVTFSVTSGGGSVTGGSTQTNGSGVATVGSWILGSTAGVNTLSAAVSGLSTPLTITATATASGGGADYLVTAFSAAATGVVGTPYTIASTVRNQGQGAGGPFRLGFYFSTDATITTSDTFSGWSCYYDTGMPANTVSDCSGTIGIPSSLPPGSYFVGAIADDLDEVAETNEGNNARAAASRSQLTGAIRPDLVVEAATSSATGVPGSAISVSATTRNTGAAAAGAFRLGVYLSTDQTITLSDRVIASCAHASGVAVGAAIDCAGSITLPSDVATGVYYIGYVADDQGAITELDESNNARASAGISIAAVARPDLSIVSMSAPTTGTLGGSVLIGAQLRNSGTAAGPFRVGFYYSTDTLITTNDTFSGSVCTYATGLAANETDDCTGSITVPTSLTAGTYYVGAIIDDEGVVSEASEANNTRRAANTTVFGSTGTTLNVLIDGMYITQATQTYTGAVPLVIGRRALMRVFVRANQTNSASVSVRARFYQNGTLLDTKTIAPPTASVPTSINEGNLGASWNLDVSAYMIAGLQVLLDVDPTNSVAESNEGDNAFPLNGTPRSMDMRAVNVYNTMLVPVVQAPNGLRGDVTEANKDSYTEFASRVYPFTSINAAVHAPYTFSQTLGTSYDNTWNALLNEMNALRLAEGNPRRYYGVLKPAYNSGGTGYGFVDGTASIGIDWTTPVNGSNTTLRAMTAAHEWGHNFGRQHINCGDPAGPDPAYPYNPNTIGSFGYDLSRGTLIPSSNVDLMTYCSPLWISDYTYRAVLTYRATRAQSLRASESATAPTRGLLVWGQIGPDGIRLEPSFEVNAPPSLPERAGPYQLTATDAAGETLFTLSFAGEEVDHAKGTRLFAYVVPLSTGAERPTSLQLAANGRAAVQRAATPALRAPTAQLAASAVRLRAAAGGRSILEWDSAESPMVMVRDPVSHQVLAFARGGRTELPYAGSTLELLLSNGSSSVTVTVSRTP